MQRQIAFISEHASPLAILGGIDSGGQNVYVAETAKQLARQGFQIDIFTRWDNPLAPKVVHWLPGIRVIHVKAGKKEIIAKEHLLQHMPEFRNDMLDFMLRENKRYLLFHAHFFMSAWIAAEIKKILGIPFVITFHALGIIRRQFQGMKDSFPEERIEIEKRAVSEADYIIAECPQDKKDLIQYYNASPQKIGIIPCGFSDKEFYPVGKTRARDILHLSKSEKIILQLGRMVPRKGIDNVISALSFLIKKGCDCKLIVVGGESEAPDDPELNRLRKLAEEKGVMNRVIFTGRKTRSELKYFYSAADVFITTPWYEPFGITPLESMACGTPVIGAGVGGIKYSVKDGETGFLVPPNNPRVLANKIDVLLNDSRLRQEMSHNALLRVNKMFTWINVCRHMENLYCLVMKNVHSYESQGYIS